MAQVFISVGSNLDKEKHIQLVINELAQQFGKLTLSSIYESPAVGFSGPNFYNLVVGFNSKLSAQLLAKQIKNIENRYSVSEQPHTLRSRTLDLDFLLYGDLINFEQDLELPSSDIIKYAFVLRPLAEIAGSNYHPMIGQTFLDLWVTFNQQALHLKPVELTLRETSE